MKLYLIYQNENDGYDTYDSAVVAAVSEEEAQRIYPSDFSDWEDDYGPWASKPENVKVTYLGEAAKGTKSGVIVASFNAG